MPRYYRILRQGVLVGVGQAGDGQEVTFESGDLLQEEIDQATYEAAHDQLMPKLPPLTLESRKAQAYVSIDVAAEAARLTWITDGAGQAMEYREAQDEATRFLSAPEGSQDPDDYPFLVAEQQAFAIGQGVQQTLAEIATTIHYEYLAWRHIGSTIRFLRREAKMRVELATSIAEIEAAEAIDWPRLPTS